MNSTFMGVWLFLMIGAVPRPRHVSGVIAGRFSALALCEKRYRRAVTKIQFLRQERE